MLNSLLGGGFLSSAPGDSHQRGLSYARHSLRGAAVTAMRHSHADEKRIGGGSRGLVTLKSKDFLILRQQQRADAAQTCDRHFGRSLEQPPVGLRQLRFIQFGFSTSEFKRLYNNVRGIPTRRFAICGESERRRFICRRRLYSKHLQSDFRI